jgi:hypothetical protein
LAVVSFCGTAAAAEPDRSGFTGDLGLGFALVSVPVHKTIHVFSGGIPTYQGTTTHRELKVGYSPLSLSVGAFLTPDVAMLFRLSGTAYLVAGDQYDHSFYGPIVEFWPHDRVFLSGGFGLALLGPDPLLSSSDAETELGFAPDLRAGVALINDDNHDLTLSAEFIPGFYDVGNVQGYAIVAAWKWY